MGCSAEEREEHEVPLAGVTPGMRRREQPGAAAPEESWAHAGKVLAANEAGREQSGALTQK